MLCKSVGDLICKRVGEIMCKRMGEKLYLNFMHAMIQVSLNFVPASET